MKSRSLIFSVVITLALLVGSCSAPVTPQIPQPSQQPFQPTPVEPNAPTTAAQPSLFKFIQTVAVTPDETYQSGSFPRLHYVPATNRLVMVFGSWDPEAPQEKHAPVSAYKGYTLDMQPTGEQGIFLRGEGCDSDSLMVSNSLYIAFCGMNPAEKKEGWWFYKYDALTWQQEKKLYIPVKKPPEHTDGPSLAYVNGMIDLFDVYNVSGGPMLAPIHHFFTADLEPIEVRTLAEGSAMYNSSIMYVDGVYHQITGTMPDGDLVVRRYDQDWNFLGEKTVRQKALLPFGALFDGQRFYVAFQDNSLYYGSGIPPLPTLNIHLAAFDRDWNLIEDIPVTAWSPSDEMYNDMAGLLLHEGQLYVTYASAKNDAEMKQLCSGDTICPIPFQAYVSVYELVQDAP
jgi:hypothetical protein